MGAHWRGRIAGGKARTNTRFRVPTRFENRRGKSEAIRAGLDEKMGVVAEQMQPIVLV